MKKIIFIGIIGVALISSCTKEEESSSNDCPAGSPNIVGAVCNDGTTSFATGSGACSSHGGVKNWICK